MGDLLQILSKGGETDPQGPPRHVLALVFRCNDDLLFVEGGLTGACPYLFHLKTTEPLPPTLGPEGVLLWARRAADSLGVPEGHILSRDICPAEPMLPFDNVVFHIIILDVTEAEIARLEQAHPKSARLAANFVMVNIGRNFFFRPVSESYRAPRQ